MKLETEHLILEKARAKKDGCYRFRGTAYRVRDGVVTHFAEGCKILKRYCGMNVIVGEYKFSLNSDEAGQKILKSIQDIS